jgi:hypothetical protein
MKLGALLSAPLGVDVCTPDLPGLGDVQVRWISSNELIDPTPFVDAGAFLVITGLGLNVRDDRTWDAYVERLVDASIAALGFRVGVAHAHVPDQLIAACARWRLPLLRIGLDRPFSVVEQFVLDRVRTEHARAEDASWHLAERLATSVAAGTDLKSLLELVSTALGARVALLDGNGHRLGEWPPVAPEAAAGSRGRTPTGSTPGVDAQQVLVPVAGLDTHTLVVVRPGTGVAHTPLNPVASILSLHLERLLAATSVQHSSMLARLEEQLKSWETPGHAIARTLSNAGLPFSRPLAVAVGRVDAGSANAMFSLRLQLAEVFEDVRVSVRGGAALLLFRPADDASIDAAVALLQDRHPSWPFLVSGPCADPEELRLRYLAARARVRTADGPRRAPVFDLLGLVTGGAGRASRRAAEKFLQPLVDHDLKHRSALVQTLRTFVRCDGRPGRVAEELHVHRNTLSYRLRQLEQLLGLSLTSLAGLATCVTALDLLDGLPEGD